MDSTWKWSVIITICVIITVSPTKLSENESSCWLFYTCHGVHMTSCNTLRTDCVVDIFTCGDARMTSFNTPRTDCVAYRIVIFPLYHDIPLWCNNISIPGTNEVHFQPQPNDKQVNDRQGQSHDHPGGEVEGALGETMISPQPKGRT